MLERSVGGMVQATGVSGGKWQAVRSWQLPGDRLAGRWQLSGTGGPKNLPHVSLPSASLLCYNASIIKGGASARGTAPSQNNRNTCLTDSNFFFHLILSLTVKCRTVLMYVPYLQVKKYWDICRSSSIKAKPSPSWPWEIHRNSP